MGGCSANNVFVGGFREFVYINGYTIGAQASRLRNHYLLYDPSIIAYNRFTQYDSLYDEFKVKKA